MKRIGPILVKIIRSFCNFDLIENTQEFSFLFRTKSDHMNLNWVKFNDTVKKMQEKILHSRGQKTKITKKLFQNSYSFRSDRASFDPNVSVIQHQQPWIFSEKKDLF